MTWAVPVFPAGKTGTAQVKRISKRERELDLELEQIPYKDRDHALYVAYGPYVNPRYALSIIVEHGGSGSKAAAPIAIGAAALLPEPPCSTIILSAYLGLTYGPYATYKA